MQMAHSLLALLLAACQPGSQAMRKQHVAAALVQADVLEQGSKSAGGRRLVERSEELKGNVLRKEDFDGLGMGSKFAGISDTRIVAAPGREGRALRATYKPTSEGSARLTEKWPIARTTSAKVSFDVYFDEGFEFVKGGKLGFGLFGGSHTTGCKDITPDGWSARVTWSKEGTFKLYYYHQKRPTRCGDSRLATVGGLADGTPVKLQQKRWYSFALQVKVNDLGKSNGEAVLSLDGAVVVKLQGVQFRAPCSGKQCEDSVITATGFNTFYGGSSPSFAPSKTTQAFFDNYLVVNLAGGGGGGGGFCQKGTLHEDGDVCCGKCGGKCGAPGCGTLPGGSSQCCVGGIRKSGKMCSSRSSTGCIVPESERSA